MEVAVNYKLYADESNIKTEGEAKAKFDDQYLTLTVMFGEPMLFAYTDIVGISDYDYKVDLFLSLHRRNNTKTNNVSSMWKTSRFRQILQ